MLFFEVSLLGLAAPASLDSLVIALLFRCQSCLALVVCHLRRRHRPVVHTQASRAIVRLGIFLQSVCACEFEGSVFTASGALAFAGTPSLRPHPSERRRTVIFHAHPSRPQLLPRCCCLLARALRYCLFPRLPLQPLPYNSVRIGPTKVEGRLRLACLLGRPSYVSCVCARVRARACACAC